MNVSVHNVSTPHYGPMKSERLEARVNLEQKKMFQYAANLSGRTLTDFIISALQLAANRVIREQTMLQLTASDRKFFVKTLLKAPKPNSHLLKAVKRHQKLVMG